MHKLSKHWSLWKILFVLPFLYSLPCICTFSEVPLQPPLKHCPTVLQLSVFLSGLTETHIYLFSATEGELKIAPSSDTQETTGALSFSLSQPNAVTKPSTFYTLDQWFSNFSLYQNHLEPLLKWVPGPRVSDFSRSGVGWENAFLTSPGWRCCCCCRSRPPLAEPVTALSHKTGSYQKKPMALVQ